MNNLSFNNLLQVFTALIVVLIGVWLVDSNAHAQASWYDGGWQYRQQITIDADQVDSNLSDFTVYVDLSNLGSPFFDNVNADCGDIRVTQSDGTTEVAREVVSCDTGGETGELHFKAPTVSSSSDTSFYVYYGNGSASNYNDSSTYGAENVWTNDFEAVYHLEEDPSGTAPQMIDSTANNDGTTEGSMSSGDSVSGQLSGGALDFDGSDDGVRIPDSTDFTIDQATLSIWFQTTQSGANFLAGNGGGWSDSGYNLFVYNSGVRWEMQTGSTKQAVDSNNFQSGAWTKITGVYDGSKQIIYRNGSPDNSTSISHPTFDSSFDFGIGKAFYSSYGGDNLNGNIDEVKLASIGRSDGWISAEYTNQNTPTTFYTAASQETQTAGDPELSSSNYAVVRSSLNSGGRDQVSSANYQVADTVGEQATGESDSANYQVQVGYRQMRSSNIAISAQQDINLGSFGGVDGGAAEATPSMNVITDNEAGYELSVKADTSPAMQNTSAGGSFADYNAGTDPSYNFSVSASESAFGFSPEGANVTQEYLDNGSNCSTGSQENASHCWRGFTTSDQLIAQSSDNNQPDGATTTLRLRAESGANNIQTAGTYEATITVTAVAI
jgi:hypothetical protein